MDALSHSFLHLIEVLLHVLDNVPTLLILFLQGKKLPLELISLVGCVLKLLSEVIKTLLQLI